jgi:hypothetical protein
MAQTETAYPPMIAVKRLAIRLAFADGHPEVVKLVIVPAHQV